MVLRLLGAFTHDNHSYTKPGWTVFSREVLQSLVYLALGPLLFNRRSAHTLANRRPDPCILLEG